MVYFMKILDRFQANKSNLKLENVSDNMNKEFLGFLVYLSMYNEQNEIDIIFWQNTARI